MQMNLAVVSHKKVYCVCIFLYLILVRTYLGTKIYEM
jgi:hypothetical protein